MESLTLQERICRETAAKKLPRIQIEVLTKMFPNKRMRVAMGNSFITLQGYIDNRRVCREKTWQSLLKNGYIRWVNNFVYELTNMGRRVVESR